METESAIHVWLVLSRAYRAVERNALMSITCLGLGLSDFAVLELLLHKGPQPVNRLGRKVLLTSGSISTAVDRLEARGLVQRTIAPADLRSRIVDLTAEGRTLIEQGFAKHATDLEQTMAELPPDEREDLVRLLKKMGLAAAARAEALDAARQAATSAGSTTSIPR